MKKVVRVTEAVDRFKALTQNLTESEKEVVRDQLLAFLLFGDSNNAIKNSGTLTEEERRLIKTLADQTDRLHRLMSDEDGDQ